MIEAVLNVVNQIRRVVSNNRIGELAPFPDTLPPVLDGKYLATGVLAPSSQFPLLAAAANGSYNEPFNQMGGNLPTGYCSGIVFVTSNNIAVANGNGGCAYSTNAGVSFATSTGSTLGTVTAIANNGATVLVRGTTSPYLFRSTNSGASFASVTNPTTAAPSWIGFINNLWVACGADGILTSADGSSGSWTVRLPNPPGAINHVAYNGTLWVAVGAGGIIYTAASATGAWTARTSGTSANLDSIVWFSGQWVAHDIVGGSTRLSTDGLSWSAGPALIASSFTYNWRATVINGAYCYGGMVYATLQSAPTYKLAPATMNQVYGPMTTAPDGAIVMGAAKGTVGAVLKTVAGYVGDPVARSATGIKYYLKGA